MMGYWSSLVGCHQKLALSMEVWKILGFEYCVHTWIMVMLI